MPTKSRKRNRTRRNARLRESPPPRTGGRRVYMVTGGVTKFAKAHPEMDFRLMVKRAYDAALHDVPNLPPSPR